MDLGAIDPNHDANLESMRRQARSSHVLKRHDDLRKQCEREMQSYDKAKRLTASQCRHSQILLLNRMKKLLSYSSSSSSSPTSSATLPHSLADLRLSERRHTDADDDSLTTVRHARSSMDDVPRNVRSAWGGRGLGRKGVRSAPVSARSGSYYQSSSSRCSGRERFLFRVLWRNGKEVYIRDESEARKSRELLNGVSSTRDEFRSAWSSRRRTVSARP